MYSNTAGEKTFEFMKSKKQGLTEMTVVLDVVKVLDIDLKISDIQRVHRLGKKKRNSRKPRPIIARLVSYRKRNKFLFKKSKLRNNEQSSTKLSTKLRNPNFVTKNSIHSRRSHPTSAQAVKLCEKGLWG